MSLNPRRWRRRSRVAAGAGGVLALSWLVAAGGVQWGEVGATEALNDLPGPVIDALEVVMQLGARPAIVLVAIVGAVVSDRRRWRVAGLVVLAGALSWFASTIVKDVVERPRPAPAGAEVVVRDDAPGFGFPSGHVSIAAGSLTALALSTGRRPDAALAVAGVVGAGRMAVGVHLPLDVVGGLAVGALSASVVLILADR